MMIKAMIIAVLIVMSIVSLAFAGAIEELEARGIDRGAIEKVRMTIYENPQYKGLGAAIYFCELVRTRKDVEAAITTAKKIKGKSGNPSYSRLERLDNSYATNTMEIKEQKELYKAAFGKGLNVGVCKNKEALSARQEKLHDQLLNKSFAAASAKRLPLPN
jgi:hypothetical protein